jgi:hypothetical protein
MKAVGIPERKLKGSSHYESFVRTVESTFIMFCICSKRSVIKSFEVRNIIELLKRRVGRWCRSRG